MACSMRAPVAAAQRISHQPLVRSPLSAGCHSRKCTRHATPKSLRIRAAEMRLPTSCSPKVSSPSADVAATSNSSSWDAVYHDGQSLPSCYLDPSVAVSEVSGKGRGLVATQNMQAGQLVLVCDPLVYLSCPPGDVPDMEDLLERLNNGMYTERQLAWLRCLTAGEGVSSPGPVPELQVGLMSTVDGPLRALTEEDVEEALRLNLLALNAFGEEAQDLTASLARAETEQGSGYTDAVVSGHLGVWPEFSLINHSCAPSCNMYTLGQRMVVRTGMAVSQGSELSINYLGRASLRPASERLMDLKDGYGFSCGCTRCHAELDGTPELVGTVGNLYAAVANDLVPTLQEVLGGDAGVQAGDARALAAVAAASQRLQPLLASLEVQLAREGAEGATSQTAQQVDWLRASAFEAYALQSQITQAEAQLLGTDPTASTPAPLRRLLSISNQVAPGSDLSLFLACKALRAEQQQVPEGPIKADAVLAAQAVLERVTRLRYGGDLSQRSVSRLMRAALVAVEQVQV